MIRKQRGDPEKALSLHWQGMQTTIGRTVRFLPLWVSASVVALLLAGVFFSLNVDLNRRSDPLFSSLAALKVPSPPAPTVTIVAKPVQPRLSKFLNNEIKAGQLEVREDETTSVVSIRGDGIFESGSATVDRAVIPLIGRISEALNSVPGQVLVTGHTDNEPMRSARFPSNWHLSQERANSVSRAIAISLKDPARLRAEGRADTVPVAANDSPANRALNRRVEIVLKVAEQ
jgi:type VI secretion system protein ImpK